VTGKINYGPEPRCTVLDVREMTGRLRAITASVALALPFLIAAAPLASADIKIGIIGDQTGAADLDKAYGVLQQGVDALNRERPDVVLHAGDLVESRQTPDQITARFNQATAILGGLVSPWYMTAGDHDVSPYDFVQNSPDHSREALFQALYAKLNPVVQKRLYYSFDVKGYHFVVLYSTEALDSDPRWGNIFYAGVSDAQYEWLAADLAAHAASRGVFVLVHQPLWYMWSTWDRVHQLLARYPTRAVIAGHFHYNQADSRIDNIAYRVVGATGGDTKQGSANAGDLQHVTILTAKDDGSLDFRIVPLTPYAQIAWTSREIMDRIQAQDVLLATSTIFPRRATSSSRTARWSPPATSQTRPRSRSVISATPIPSRSTSISPSTPRTSRSVARSGRASAPRYPARCAAGSIRPPPWPRRTTRWSRPTPIHRRRRSGPV